MGTTGQPARERVGCVRRDLVVVLGVLLSGLISACGSSAPPASTTGIASDSGMLDWTVDDLDLPGELRDVASAEDRLVAVGFSHWEEPAISAVLVSDDRGQTWQPAAADGLDAGSMVAVTNGPTGFVAVGRHGGRGPGLDGAVWSSDDGIRWQPVDPPTRAGSADLQAVVASEDRYAAGGMDGPMPVVWISTDGLIWLEAVPFYGSRDYPPDADLTGDAVSALANSDGRFVAAISLGAHRGEIWASDDGLTWAPIGKIDGAYWVSRFARDEQGWLAIGTAVDDAGPHGFIWSSPDGVSWAMVAELGPGDGRGLAAGAGGFLATSIGWHGEPGIWTSTDGGMWFLDEAATKGAMGAAAGNVIAIDEGYLGVGSRGATVDDSTMVIWHGAAAP